MTYEYHPLRKTSLTRLWIGVTCVVCALGLVACVARNHGPLNRPEASGTVESCPQTTFQPGPARFDHLSLYFKDANPALFSHFERLQRLHERGDNHWGISYVAGTSGVGKSYVVGNLAMLDKGVTQTIKLSKVFSGSLPDLQSVDGQVVFNRLPCAKEAEVQGVLDSVDHHKAFVILDDLDEVHEDTAVAILKALDTYVTRPHSGFKHFIVFGRPESFWPWLNHASRTPLILQGPEYLTHGDVAFRCHDYYGFKFSKPAPQLVIDDLISQLTRFPFLRDTMRPLSAGNFVLDDSVARCDTQVALLNTPDALKQRLFEQLMARNVKSHGRPGANDPVYLSLLKQAAALPDTHNRPLDEQGFFEVRQEDMLSFADHQVCARDVLNRSGLITLDVTDTQRARYRFEPFWVQAFLVQKIRSAVTEPVYK